MKFKNLKLSGFKSFVDATNVSFPSDRVGIIGPNGCGKSNIFDGVRWVMGESSAKLLRGESMSDVIFNGSSARHPVGQASVELRFDNSDATLTGEYAKYSEIGIKRVVTREGQSNYFINNIRCRRRDVADFFLGTGLGARSYAIIEQGMISQFIEAKPEDLRLNLEEAAGISKYKERRRETENRIRHTLDNMNRINDIREELEKQLKHLNRQARAAERYTELKQEERTGKAQLLGLRWQLLDVQLQEQRRLINQEDVKLEATIAEQTHIGTEIEKHHITQTESNEAFHRVQENYYRARATVTQLEEKLKHQRERTEQLRGDLQQLDQDDTHTQINIDEDLNRSQTLHKEVTELHPALQAAQSKAESIKDALVDAEHAMQTWQEEWDTFQQTAAQTSEMARVEQTRIQHLEENQRKHQLRIEQLEQEHQTLESTDLEQNITELTTQKTQKEQQCIDQQTKVINLQEAITHQRQDNHQGSAKLDELRHELQQLRGKYASLEALQEEALGKSEHSIVAWITQHQLADRPRLGETLTVSEKWEQAVEIVLSHYLQGVCVDDLNPFLEKLDALDEGDVVLLDTQTQHDEKSVRSHSHLQAVQLSEKLTNGSPVIKRLLQGIYAIDHLSDALPLISELSNHESIITQDGIWLGKGWVRIAHGTDKERGVLSREQTLKQLNQAIGELTTSVEEQEKAVLKGREKLVSLEKEREEEQLRLSELTSQTAEQKAQLHVKETRLEQSRQRAVKIQEDLDEQIAQQSQCEKDLQKAREAWQDAMDAIEKNTKQRERIQTRREELQTNLVSRRDIAKQHQESMHELTVRLQTTESQQELLQRQIERMNEQRVHLETRRERLITSLKEIDDSMPAIETELEQALEKQLSVDTELTSAKQRVNQMDAELQQLEQRRTDIEQGVRNAQTHVESLRLEAQSWQVRCHTLEEQLSEMEQYLQDVIANMPEEASVDVWEMQLVKLEQRIHRLGPINLAAIDEYKTQAERKEYLDAQYNDLQSALDTLQEAIRKIDRETRARFKETFDAVNASFQELFPKLFGGGCAKLVLTGEDLLDTGVAMMAQPPGKRNANIHVLSGGEKALTTIALVFAIFQLNPAPFCLLDEVDAPLDDANVVRFCQLLQEMSSSVQFIFVTHNKLTMEIADHLIGVTMHEPGVSRLVSVDIDEAVALAEAG